MRHSAEAVVASIIQDSVSPPVPRLTDGTEIQTPPPQCTAASSSPPLDIVIPAENGTVASLASQTPIKEALYQCIFCRRRFARKGAMWDCAERHLIREETQAMLCPIPEFKP